MSVHEFVASLREHFYPSPPQRTEQEVIEITAECLGTFDSANSQFT